MHAVALDAVLMAFALAAYAIGAVILFAFFLTREDWLRGVGATLAVAGCAAQFAQLVARYAETHVWPLLNLYGSLSLFAAMAVAIYVAFAFRYRLWFAGGFVLAFAAVFLAYGVTWNEGVMPAVPSLQSYWAKIHVPLIVSSYGAFLVSFVFSLLYLVKFYANERYSRRTVSLAAGGPHVDASVALSVSAAMSAAAAPSLRDTPALAAASERGDSVAAWFGTLPSLAQIDIVVYRVISVGLPLLTLGVITGAAWAHEAWGAYWQWDPKETAALASWIVYAAYMHLHTRSAWRGLRCSWCSVVGFASILFCYFAVNLVFSGLHSYAR